MVERMGEREEGLTVWIRAAQADGRLKPVDPEFAAHQLQGLLKTLIGLAARLPWWLGLALALVSYVALHILAQKPVPAAMQPGQMGSFLLANLTQLLARVGQYALPFFFGVSALVSAFRRGR